uniref:Uncharacterized protein n=1 Tax=Salix viminalis TaxID=40686 RepID=A0A6N2KZL6_SALVM
MMLPFTPPSTMARAACFRHAAVPRTFTANSLSDKSSLLTEACDAGIAEYYVKVTVKLNGGFHEGFDLVFIGYITVNVSGSVSSDGFCEVPALFILNICNHDCSCSVLSKGKHGGLAYATSTSGDDSNLTLNFVLVRLVAVYAKTMAIREY